MPVIAIDRDRHLLAELRPAGAAMAAYGAAFVMMDHHPLADLGLGRADGGANRRDDAARLVPSDGRRARRREAAGLAARFRPAVLWRRATCPRPHLDDDLVWV